MTLIAAAPRRPRRALAAALALILGATGAVALSPEPAAAAYPDTFNPFAMSGGFTVYAREDATLGNDETEGSVAVGGTLTKPGDGQYALIHVAAGTGDYTLPTVDGDATRLLVGSYSPDSGGILAITSAGTSDPALQGDLKMVERDGPFQASQRADWLRLNLDPASPDQTPLIDATNQQYPAGAEPPTSATGGGSIYTFDTGATAVADYVEANAEASYAQASQCLADVTSTTAYQVGVAEHAGSRVVLEPLSADRPNVVDYADIAGTALIQFSPGPEPGAPNPLIIRVPAGTTDVVGARTDPQGAYSPYILWDLSAETGAVTVTAAEGRIDGSIYAPEADVTVDAAPLDGQIIGNNVTTLGGEVHSFLFAGQIACAPSTDGSFRVQKAVAGIDPADPLLADVVFTVNYSAETPDGEILTGALNLPATGGWVEPGEQFPEGTEVTFEEITPPSVPGYDWGTPTIAPNPLTITAGATADITVTNTATAQLGTFSVAKQVVDESGAPPVPAPTGTVTVTWTATYGGTELDTGTLTVPLDGTVVTAPEDFPVGTVITLTEDLSGATPPPGYDWSTASWDPGDVITIGDTGTVAVTLTNLVTPEPADRTISIVKQASGDAADPRFGYQVDYGNETGGRTTTAIELGTPVVLTDVDPAATTLDIAELIPTVDGTAVTDLDGWDNPVFRVTADVDGVIEVTEYETGGFFDDVPLDEASATIALDADADHIAIEVVNNRLEGTFSLSKAFEGIDPSVLPPGTAFYVTWTATDPAGGVSEGTVQLPADGTAVSPLDAAGDAVQFPYGTRVEFDEQTRPAARGVTWGTPDFSPASVVIGADGAATTAVTVTNSATAVTGTFQVAKALHGIAAGDLNTDAFTVRYVAITPDRTASVGSMQVPADGTPASPVDDAGAPIEFPIGTHIGLTEELSDDALPDHFEWGQPVWSPSSSLVVTGETASPPTVTVTNTAVEYAEISLTKLVTGDTDLVPTDATFTLDWWVDGEPQPPISIAAGETVTSPERFPIGSILEATEPQAPPVAGGTWQTPVFTVDGSVLPIEEDGRVAVPVSAHEQTIAFELDNVFAADDAIAAFRLEKTVTGTAATAVPADTAYPIEYRIDGGTPMADTIVAGEPLVVEDLPAAATVEVREGDLPAIAGVEWGAPAWTAGGTALSADADGWVTVPLTADGTVALELENTAARPLPATGGTFAAGVPLLAFAAIAFGALLVWRVRRSARV